MLYNLIKKYRGKEQVLMTDVLPKVNTRLKTVKSSYRGRKDIEIYVVPAGETAEKFKKKPHSGYSGDSYVQAPRKVK